MPQNRANYDVKARYFKEFWETPQENLKIDSIKFGIFSEKEIHQLSCTQITSSWIYDPDTLKPNESGPLDPHLGVSGHIRGSQCASCNLSSKECVGHFGHIDLVLPCFHIGYIKDVIQILRMICKSCSRVLLSPSSNNDNQTPTYWRQRMSARILSRRQYQLLFKQVIEVCKKRRKCTYCGELNGAIKKHTKSFRILHEKYHKIQEHVKSEAKMIENEETAYYLELYDNIIDYEQLHNPKKIAEFTRSVNTNTSQDLMPWDVRALFENIIPSEFVLIGIRFAGHRPEDLILTKLPVPPAVIRPGTKLEDDKANDDDLTAQLAKIVESNNLIALAMEKGGNVPAIIENFFFLNKKVSEYFIADLPGYPQGPMSVGSTGGRSQRRGALAGTRTNTKGKKIRSFSDRLKGKFGRFRGNLSGKRVNFSGRTVISPDPNLELDELGVPLDVCKLLTFPEMVTKHNIKRMKQLILNGPHKHPGAIQYLQRIPSTNGCINYKYMSLSKAKFRLNIGHKLLKYGDCVERHLQNGDIVLFNRQPSLHRVSILSHRVKVVPHRTFRFNPCCCNPYNADFDGDEMNIHIPQTLMARAESQTLMTVSGNFAAPKAAEPLVVPLQDLITSIYLLTLKRVFLSESSVTQLMMFMDNGTQVTQHRYVIPPPAIIKPIRLWSGKQIFSLIICGNVNLETCARNFDDKRVPNALHSCMDPRDGFVVIRNSELMCGNIDKNVLGSSTKGLFFRMLVDCGSYSTKMTMNRLSKIATRFLQQYGFSIGINDVAATRALSAVCDSLINEGYNKCASYLSSYKSDTLATDPGCTVSETYEQLMNGTLSQIREDAGKECISYLSYDYNAPLMMAECGSKGSKINISQMVMMVGQQTVSGSRVRDQFMHRTLPHFALRDSSAKAKGFVSNSFFSGLTASEFFFHTMGGREGLVDTAVKTADTGYMQRRLMKNIEDIAIEYDYTVRNCNKCIVQFLFGNDGCDPMHCESSKSPVNFGAILNNIRAQRVCIGRTRCRYNIDHILTPKEMMSFAQNLTSLCGERLYFLRRNVTYVSRKYELQFEDSLISFISNDIVCPAAAYYNGIANERKDKWYCELYGYTGDELSSLMDSATQRYILCIMEPGSAVGGVSATSLGEPATQMTLKTFHFAGVASMNITQGVPRIKEIINASAHMKTPVMTVQLCVNHSVDIARIVKSRIDGTCLGQICKFMQMVIRPQKAYIECGLDLMMIAQLHLSLTNRDIANIICSNLKSVLPKISGFRILQSDIRVATKNTDLIRVQPKGNRVSPHILGIILNHLMSCLQSIAIGGIDKVRRALIHVKYVNELQVGKVGMRAMFEKGKQVRVTHIDNEHKCCDILILKEDKQMRNIPFNELSRARYQLYVEGSECFENVLTVCGVNANESHTNDIIECAKVLGIEAAMRTIINELTNVYHSHGLRVDGRHLMLCADLMTYTGNVLGFSRHGMMGKEDKSILTMASYEETVKHLFQAALHGEKTKICGVSDSIIVGAPIPIGTGACSVLRQVERKDEHQLLKRKALLLGQCPFKAMTNNDIIV